MIGLVAGALRRPYTVLVCALGLALAAVLSAWRAPADIFPALKVPVVYVMQPYAGLTPTQVEGQLVYYYEYHFLYVAGVQRVESQSMQGLGVVKLTFHPGTDIAQAMAQVTAMAFRATSFMPAGTLPPFIVRFDAGSIPVGQLVFSGEGRTEAEIQDAALNRVRPLLATIAGVSAPPPSGGKVRTIVAALDPDRLRARHLSPDEVAAALARSEVVLPSGTLRSGGRIAMTEVNALVRDPRELEMVPLRLGAGPTVYLRDVGRVVDGADIVYNVALVNGRRTVYMPVTKRADASALDVVRGVQAAMGRMRSALPEGMDVRFEFDQSPYITNAIRGLAEEGLLGAVLTALAVLLFLRSWRSAAIVGVTIPLSVGAALVGLRAFGQTVNIMTLSGLALAVGVLVDEATVAVENIHVHLARGGPPGRAVLEAMAEVMTPRLLAVACVLAVFIPVFFISGIGASLFPPLALAVALAMVASFVVSSTVVPVLAAWALSGAAGAAHAAEPSFLGVLRAWLERAVRGLVVQPRRVVMAYALASAGLMALGGLAGTELMPRVSGGQLRLRVRAAPGTPIERTTEIVRGVEREIRDEAGTDAVDLTLANIGNPAWNFPVNALYQSNTGPQDAELLVALRSGSSPVPALEERLRPRLAKAFPDVRFSFEAGDVVSRVLNVGAPTAVQVMVAGRDLAKTQAYAEAVATSLRGLAQLRDVQLPLASSYPVMRVEVDRDRAGQRGLTVTDVGRSVLAATSSTVLTTPMFWTDPKSGTPYRVQVTVPERFLRSAEDLQALPVGRNGDDVQLDQVATVFPSSAPGAIDRVNGQRAVAVTANLAGGDLGGAGRAVRAALAKLPSPPAGASVTLTGQVAQMDEALGSMAFGLALAVVVVALLLVAAFQSVRAALVAVASTPAAVAGTVLALVLTGTTINIQSLMGAIMGIGVAVSNAVLLVSFALERCRAGESPVEAVVGATLGRLRPILMTSAAMIAGMIPMALAFGGAGAQAAPLGRAVIGSLVGATIVTLLCLPAVFVWLVPPSAAAHVSLLEEGA